MRATIVRSFCRLAVLHAAAFCAANAAMAAPMRGELAASASADGAQRDGVSGVSGVTSVQARPSNGSQTVDMLIDLQPRNAGLSFNERAPAGDRGLRTGGAGAKGNDRAVGDPRQAAAAATKTPSPEALPSGLFGAGATPQVVTERHMPSARAATAAGGGRAGSDAPAADGTPAARGELPSWLLWPRDVILFVRDNREWVIGGVIAILAAMGCMSVLSGRRRRT